MKFEIEEGDSITEDQQAIMRSYLRAFSIVRERERFYGSSWVDYGIHDKATHCRDIARRIDAVIGNMPVVGDQTEEWDMLEDLFLDLINYAAMGAFQSAQRMK